MWERISGDWSRMQGHGATSLTLQERVWLLPPSGSGSKLLSLGLAARSFVYVFRPSPRCGGFGSDLLTSLTSLHPGLCKLDTQDWQPAQKTAHALPCFSSSPDFAWWQWWGIMYINPWEQGTAHKGPSQLHGPLPNSMPSLKLQKLQESRRSQKFPHRWSL